MINVSNNQKPPDVVCEDCGAVVAEGKAGCLKLFEEILAREFSDYRYGKIHRLTVDAYSLQHPEPYMHSGKSFAAHLTGAYAALEAEDALVLIQTMPKWLNTNPEIDKSDGLRLPQHRGNLTILHIQCAANVDEYSKRVREWAEDAWSAWSEHHALAKQLVDRATQENNKR